jgi:hypothetical protein
LSRGEGASLTAGIPTPTIRREIPFLVGAAGIMLLLFGYYAYTWRSFSGFATSIDTCDRLFCDFVSFYFPMGRAIFRTALPVEGYVYSPFNAILLSVFPALGLAASMRKRIAKPNSPSTQDGDDPLASVVNHCFERGLLQSGRRPRLLWVLGLSILGQPASIGCDLRFAHPILAGTDDQRGSRLTTR